MRIILHCIENGEKIEPGLISPTSERLYLSLSKGDEIGTTLFKLEKEWFTVESREYDATKESLTLNIRHSSRYPAL